MPVYILDSNFFIQAHRSYYPIDIATGFWKKVRELAYKELIISIDKVKKEIYYKNDVLKEWCHNNLPKNFFKSTSENDIMSSYKQVIKWVMSKSQHYLPQAINEFLDANEADAFIIAYCLANPADIILVTQETSEPNRRNKVKIPDACRELNIKYVNTIELFRELGETF